MREIAPCLDDSGIMLWKKTWTSDHHLICTPGNTASPPITIWWLWKRGQNWHAVKIYQVKYKKQTWTCTGVAYGESGPLGNRPSLLRPGFDMCSLEGVRETYGWAGEVGRQVEGDSVCYKIQQREHTPNIICLLSGISVSSFSNEGSLYMISGPFWVAVPDTPFTPTWFRGLSTELLYHLLILQ